MAYSKKMDKCLESLVHLKRKVDNYDNEMSKAQEKVEWTSVVY